MAASKSAPDTSRMRRVGYATAFSLLVSACTNGGRVTHHDKRGRGETVGFAGARPTLRLLRPDSRQEFNSVTGS